MNKYTPLYGNPAGAMDYADRLYGAARVDVVQGMHSNPAEVPEVVVEAELENVWGEITQLLKDKYGVEMTNELFNSADSADMNIYLQTLVDQEAAILASEDLLEAYVDELAKVLDLEHAGEGVDDLEDLENETRTFDLAIDSVNELFPNAEDANDLIATVANALDAMESDLNVFAEPVEVVDAIKKFKSLGFPYYEPEELVELIYLTAENKAQLIAEETESMLTEDARDDAICSNGANDIILAAFGTDAAASHLAFCGLSADERIDAYNAANGNLATLFDIPQTDWDNFVLEAVSTILVPKMLEAEGAVLKEQISKVLEQASKDPKNALKTSSGSTLGRSQATSGEMTTTHKVVSGLAIVGALVGSLYFIKKVREF